MLYFIYKTKKGEKMHNTTTTHTYINKGNHYE